MIYSHAHTHGTNTHFKITDKLKQKIKPQTGKNFYFLQTLRSDMIYKRCKIKWDSFLHDFFFNTHYPLWEMWTILPG